MLNDATVDLSASQLGWLVARNLSRWWQLKYVLIFTPNLGEDEPILTYAYFSKGLVQPPTSYENINGHTPENQLVGPSKNDWVFQ